MTTGILEVRDGGGGGCAAVGGGLTAAPDLEFFFDQLDINEEEFDDVEIDDDDPEIKESVRWLALARVHTDKTSLNLPSTRI